MSCVGEVEWDIMTFREVARPVEREVERVVAARSSGAAHPVAGGGATGCPGGCQRDALCAARRGVGRCAPRG